MVSISVSFDNNIIIFVTLALPLSQLSANIWLSLTDRSHHYKFFSYEVELI